MPRNGSGVYSLPVAYEATTGQTAAASQHNDPLEDIRDDLNAARPVVAGGTGATSASAARTNLGLGSISDSFIETTVPFADDSDTTKRLKFDLSGITTGNTRTWILPDSGGTFVGTNSTQTLANKTLSDPELNDPAITDGADTSKRLKFDLSGVTTGTTRTWILPDAGGTFVGTNNTQTLANKTLSAPSVTSGLTVSGGATVAGGATFSGTTDVSIEDGNVSWGGGADRIAWVTTEGLEGYENNTRVWRIGSGTTTFIESVYSSTTANAANVQVSASGTLSRSTSSGEFKTDRAPVDGDVILSLEPVSFKSTHEADAGRRFAGFIAEDIADAFPEASIDDGQNYDVRAIVAALTAFCQSVSTRLADLERRVAAIETGA